MKKHMTIKSAEHLLIFFFSSNERMNDTWTGWRWYGMFFVWNSERPSFKTMILKITVKCSGKRVGLQSEVHLSIASAILVCVCVHTRMRARMHVCMHAHWTLPTVWVSWLETSSHDKWICLLVPAGFYPAWTFTDCLNLYLFYLGQFLEETHKCTKQQANKLIVEALN